MRGNDIVDIHLAAKESNWKRKGFLEKLFTPEEKESIIQSDDPERMVWAFWSMKEAAYKIHTRCFGGRFFAPLKFSCALETNGDGKVMIDQAVYQTRTDFKSTYIYSVATSLNDGSSSLLNQCFRLEVPEDRSGYIYSVMIKEYAKLTSKSEEFITIIKDNNGIPFLEDKKENRQIPVSITHHGRYCAFII